MPTLSVIIPNFNHAAFLPAVVAGCLRADGAADEVVIVDDASTDDSRAVLARLAAADSRVKVVAHAANRGPAAALNSGLAAARGEWVLLRAADDLCPAGSLAAFRRVADAFPAAGLITGDLVYFAADPARGTRESLGRATGPVMVDAVTYLTHFGGNIIHGACSFVRTDWARTAGGLDEDLRWHCDWYLLLQLGLTRGFVYAPEVFGAMRLNPQSYNATGTAVRATQAQVLTRLVEKLEADPALLDRMLSCGCLDFFGEPLRRIVVEGTEERRARFAALLDEPATPIAEARRTTGLATVFRAFLSRHDTQIRSHDGRIAVFGAGGHTRQLLAVWRERGLPSPVLILENNPGPDSRSFDGIPVGPPRAIAAFDHPLVVLSSKSYEPLFASTMDSLLPGVPYLKIWGADGP